MANKWHDVRKMNTKQKRVYRETQAVPGVTQKNVLYWPGFDNKQTAPLHLLSTQVDEFGGSLDTFPTYYGSAESEPGEEMREYSFPGSISRYGGPPIEPNSIYDAYKKPVRGVIEITTPEAPASIVGATANENPSFELNGIVTGLGSVELTPAQIAAAVDAKVATLPASEQAKIDKPGLLTSVWNQYTTAYSKAAQESRNPLTNRDDLPTTSGAKGLPIALAVVVGGLALAMFLSK